MKILVLRENPNWAAVPITDDAIKRHSWDEDMQPIFEEVEIITEKELNDKDMFLEPYGNGYILADYSNGDLAGYCGVGFDWRRQPLTSEPWPTKEAALEALSNIGKGESACLNHGKKRSRK